MKKILLTILAVLAIAAAATGPARAQSNSEELFYTLDGTQTGGSSAYNESSAITQGGISWSVTGNTTISPWRIGGKSLNAVDRDVYCQGSLDETITKVSFDFGTNSGVTVNSVTMIVASDVNFADIIEQKTVSYSANSTVDVTPGAGFEWTNAYYMFTFNVTVSGSSNKYFRLNAIRFYYDPNAGSTTPEPEPTTTNRTLTGVPQGWQVQAGDPLTVVDSNADGSYSIAAGQPVRLVPSAEDKPRVKSVTLVDASAPAGPTLDLATVTEATTVEDGYTLTGTLGARVKISIADGATVTLDGVTINGVGSSNCKWAGITCLGDATIILSGTNTVKGFYSEYPGIYVPENKTVTIEGSGSLTASSNGSGCGIGGGDNKSCGNIVIAGGTITATGGLDAAGIGGGHNGSCGNISITGGTITATSSEKGAGIGSGNGGSCGDISITGGNITATGGDYAAGIGSGEEGDCGNITITNGVTSVTATMGEDADYSIGAGYDGDCGTVTVMGATGPITTSPYTYPPTLDLATVTTATTVEDGYTLTGTLGANVKISIADGATVTLDGVTINGVGSSNCKWAGITCLGDATIILSGTNTVKGFYENYPGIYVPQDKTVTIQGSGSLTASSNGYGCGIGGGYQIAGGNIVIAGGTITATGGGSSAGIGGGKDGSCGDISITGGTITATGGRGGAGIGGGNEGSCGNISITGGTVNATGGQFGAGIGSGNQGQCGTVTITNGVTSVTATMGEDAYFSIGPGSGGNCGTVTIGVATGPFETSPYTYPQN